MSLKLCVVSALIVSSAAGLLRGAETAGDILEATGVKGGLVVHLGCGDGKLTAALRAGDSYLVHGLDADAANVEKARAHVRSLGLYGKVSIDRWAGKRLPYVDNLINLVVSERPAAVAAEEMLRVLAPNGVAYVRKGNRWTKTVKQRPGSIDEWTHYLHDASNNAVSHDSVVGPPRRMQWVGSPRWSRHHDRMASMSALVSAGGRIFYIFDEGPTASVLLPPKRMLIARDAFNGTVLWKRPVPKWHTHLWPFKSGPAQLQRRLVAVGETVYVTLGLREPLTALDAATGRTLRTYADSKATEEVIASDGVLFLLVNASPEQPKQYTPIHRNVGQAKSRVAKEWPWDEKERFVTASQADTGKVLWRKARRVVPLTLAADAKGVFFHDGEKVVCLDRKTGKETWSSAPVATRPSIPSSFGPTLVVYRDVVLFAGGDRSMTALARQTGKTLWTGKHLKGGHNSPEDLLVLNGVVWSGQIASGRDSGLYVGLDVRTGEVKSEFTPDVQTHWFHHRCYRAKATDRYLLPSRTGIEFVDVRKKHWTCHHWVRGGCIYGIMPCNGLVYAPPHSCGCYLVAKQYGFNALAPSSAKATEGRAGTARLEKGPAYGQIRNPQSAIRNRDDWPTYRHDPGRSGCTSQAVPTKLARAWQKDLGGKLTSVVVAGGRLFVASVDTHTVHALDAGSGKVLWSYAAGGRVDSPPTIYQGRVLFGCADGWVYCLRASDGKLAWRFRAAPDDRRLVAFEQVESVWPVHGSVLVQKDILYCVAGRSMFLDGGLRLLRLDPKTGRKLSETVLDDRDPETGKNLQVYVKGLNMPTALPDVLSSDGRYVYMRSQQFDLEGGRTEIVTPTDAADQKGEGAHLFGSTGFLDGTWFHRGYWIFGKTPLSGAGGYYRAGHYAPAGRILALDDSAVYGYGRKPQYFRWTTPLEYHLFASSKSPEIIQAPPARPAAKKAARPAAKAARPRKQAQPKKKRRARPRPARIAYRWSQETPLHVRAMVLAGKTLFIAGPPDVLDEEKAFDGLGDAALRAKLEEQAASLAGKKGALLLAVSASDGGKLAEYRLESPPEWDAMAAANGRLYFSTTDGKVLCFTGR